MSDVMVELLEFLTSEVEPGWQWQEESQEDRSEGALREWILAPEGANDALLVSLLPSGWRIAALMEHGDAAMLGADLCEEEALEVAQMAVTMRLALCG
ncbi:hypothetical protein MYSTI_01819 [Myxococcus stipitatus DSM 14675]|uniref:Uncharacterized protein n=1 Tax=Myxococcus stipitatus (strain DSM 14675 / JCM 12634 / Mx s8) TaxID=1278073 RepID=L7U2Z4_MYXSD|nr:hypothetical protein [Myxococcus stipitatus]AGC43151.1 hypothetical protein MYSTI_01819 [Myxococcus stipitatus DSM 14675]